MNVAVVQGTKSNNRLCEVWQEGFRSVLESDTSVTYVCEEIPSIVPAILGVTLAVLSIITALVYWRYKKWKAMKELELRRAALKPKRRRKKKKKGGKKKKKVPANLIDTRGVGVCVCLCVCMCVCVCSGGALCTRHWCLSSSLDHSALSINGLSPIAPAVIVVAEKEEGGRRLISLKS